MRIIQLVYHLRSGGAEKFVADLCNQQIELGHDVTLCMLNDDRDPSLIFNKQFLDSRVKFHSMGFSRGFSIKKSKKLEQFIRNQRPDIVHCHLNVIPYIYRLALINRNIKFFHTLHNIAENTGGTGVQYYLNRFFYKYNYIRPICISRLCQESYESYYKLHNAPYIDNGRALIATSPDYENVKSEVDSYRITSNTHVFIHVARCSEQKNQRLLVDAFNQLEYEGVDFILLILGTGFDSKEGLELQNAACPQIHFLGEKNNVNDYLHCADAFCLTSIYEGLPISLLEALSCGVVPICTPVGGIPDVITDGKTGFLSVDTTIASYVETVKRFLSERLCRQDLIEYYKRDYSMATCATKYEKVYGNIN